MLLPGPEAQQLATYLGWLFHGVKGGLIAGILFILPSLFILIGLNILYVTYGNIAWVAALFAGLKPAVVAIIAVALIKIGKKSLQGYLHYALALSSFIAIYFFNIAFPLIILCAILVATALKYFAPQFFKGEKESVQKEMQESEYMINSHTFPSRSFSFFNLGKIIGTGILLWTGPLVLCYYASSDWEFWKTLTGFFTKAALATFGGAYAVLPYVAQVSVEKLHWLSHYQMIDGLALGETTPGPLIMVLVFVGFMGGYHHYGHSLFHGVAASCTTAFYTFLPSFIFIFAGAPLIEKIHGNLKIKALMSLVSAAVVGVILNLTIYLTVAVVAPNGIKEGISYLNIAWILISFLALYKFKVNMILWIGVSALVGLISYLVV
jgi:chromate transporter